MAVILAAGMASALNLFIVGAMLEAYANPITLPIGLSDNATQVLTGWGGGIVGVIGALVGVRVGRNHQKKKPDEPPEEEPPPPDSGADD